MRIKTFIEYCIQHRYFEIIYLYDVNLSTMRAARCRPNIVTLLVRVIDFWQRPSIDGGFELGVSLGSPACVLSVEFVVGPDLITAHGI